MKSFLLFTLAALSTIFAADSDAKLETACKPCNQPCPARCPDDVLNMAARILVGDLCGIFATTSMVQLQTLATPRSTMETVFLTDNGCIDSGVVNLLAGAVPLLPILSCTTVPHITSSYIDNNKNVVVFAEGPLQVLTEVVTVKARFTFESVNGGCELKLLDALIRQVECI